MAVTVTKPTSRADDTRALKRRLRRLTFSSTYATGGYNITAASLGLLRIVTADVLQPVVKAVGGITGELATCDVAADQKSATVKLLEDAATAAGTTIGVEKNNAEAHVANSFVDIEFIGF